MDFLRFPALLCLIFLCLVGTDSTPFTHHISQGGFCLDFRRRFRCPGWRHMCPRCRVPVQQRAHPDATPSVLLEKAASLAFPSSVGFHKWRPGGLMNPIQFSSNQALFIQRLSPSGLSRDALSAQHFHRTYGSCYVSAQVAGNF